MVRHSLDDGQAQARTRNDPLGALGGTGAAEALEHGAALGLRNARSRVGDLQNDIRRCTLLSKRDIDAALERAYTRLALKRAGITDVEGFKKKAAGQPGMKP